MQALAVAWPALLLSGCFAIEAAVEPRASALMQVPAQATITNVFDCTQASIPARGRGWFDPRVTRIDRERGVIETGNYSHANIVGLRTRVVFVPEAQLIFLRLKAAASITPTSVSTRRHWTCSAESAIVLPRQPSRGKKR
ncbi:hypothetical protein [Lysobacter sp.]|uniref:hypothetical protein n=1 Tax=Lysobacter sp. TaxID=72226 RepID=UPI002D6E50E7|nr:hypothetical protein [Lysobacter sp.]HZX77620.1 hypothetical protein [Lysobacter sp.]